MKIIITKEGVLRLLGGPDGIEVDLDIIGTRQSCKDVNSHCQEIARLVSNSEYNKIRIIKSFRSMTGFSLSDSKKIVEAFNGISPYDY